MQIDFDSTRGAKIALIWLSLGTVITIVSFALGIYFDSDGTLFLFGVSQIVTNIMLLIAIPLSIYGWKHWSGKVGLILEIVIVGFYVFISSRPDVP